MSEEKDECVIATEVSDVKIYFFIMLRFTCSYVKIDSRSNLTIPFICVVQV